MKWISSFVVVALSMTLISCKQDESNDLAKAQKCLDEVPATNPGAANACLPYVAKYDSQQANILKCSIYMTSGGLVETKIVAAYKAVEDKSNNNREAAFMSILALNFPSVNEGYNIAVLGDGYCQRTGVPGLQYISGIVKIGSFMAKTIASYNSSINFNDTAAVATAVNDLVAKCNTDPRPMECAGDLADMGAAATALSGGYCSADNSDSEVCENINAAVVASNGNPSAVGNALMCFLGNKTYNAATDKCNP